MPPTMTNDEKNTQKEEFMMVDSEGGDNHVRNQVLSICDLKQQGDLPAGKAGGSVCLL